MRRDNLAVARSLGYKDREEARRPRHLNPFPPTEGWASLRGAWYDGWDKANYEAEGAPF